MQVIPFVRNFEVAASVHCSPKIISLETLPTQFVMHSTVFLFFFWFLSPVLPAGNRTSSGRGFRSFPAGSVAVENV